MRMRIDMSTRIEKRLGKAPLLTVVCFAQFLDLLNLSSTTIALPAIARDLNFTPATLQWVLSAYALTFGGFLLLGGRLGDLIGHRHVLLFGQTVFTIFSVVAGLAPTNIGLVIARALQGIGAAATIPSGQAIISHSYPSGKARGRALAMWAAAGSIGFVLGIVLGGLITPFIGWRWIFYISAMVSGSLLLISLLIVPTVEAIIKSNERTLKHVLTKYLDLPGTFTSIAAIALLVYAFTTGGESGWSHPHVVVTLIMAIVLWCAFIWVESWHPNPLMPLRLFRLPNFAVTVAMSAMLYATRQTVAYFVALELQTVAGYSPLKAAIAMIPFGITSFIVNMGLAPFVSSRIVVRICVIIGFIPVIISTILLSFYQTSPDRMSYWPYVFPGLVLFMAGCSLVYLSANYTLLMSCRQEDQGIASGIFNVAIQVGGVVIGLAVTTAIATGVDGGNETRVEGYRAAFLTATAAATIGLLLGIYVSIFGKWDAKEVEEIVPNDKAKIEEEAVRADMAKFEEKAASNDTNEVSRQTTADKALDALANAGGAISGKITPQSAQLERQSSNMEIKEAGEAA